MRSASLLLTFVMMAQSCASSSNARDAAALASYMKLYDEHRKAICPAGTEEEFNALLKRFRGFGLWVPEVNGDVDFVSVEAGLPELERKLKWIQQQRASLQKLKKVPTAGQVTGEARAALKKLLSLKQTWDTSPEGPEKKRAGELSSVERRRLSLVLDALAARAPFLTNFAFPVDHLKNRKVHDEFKARRDATSEQIANLAFFRRRLVEDGAYNPDHTSSDSWLRTTLDTVRIDAERPSLTLEENLRYDLEYVLDRVDKELARGKAALDARLGEWEARTSQALLFYRDLIDPAHREKIRALVREKNQATLQLKEWVFTRQARSWDWWRRQSEDMKALYALETILINEVGDVDSGEALERLDVAQVVLNRKGVPFYHALDPAQDLYRSLRSQGLSDKQIQGETWLNILYRIGEVSFPYYYMPGAVKAFCPDLTPVGRRLTRENSLLSLALLRSPRPDFPALRYFSRASMPGRINMASVWEDYRPFPERAGVIVDGQAALRKKLAAGELRYLYHFSDPAGVEHRVYQNGDKNFAARQFEGQWVFHQWRNPHYFTYFVLR